MITTEREEQRPMKRCSFGIAIVLAIAASMTVAAQRGGRDGGPPPTPKASAPVDFTGYWVSIVTQDWRQRMVTPPKGDYASLPITLEAKKAGDAWDPAKDEAAGEQCKGYGVGGIMQMPTRLNITWLDDQKAFVGCQMRDDVLDGPDTTYTRRVPIGFWQTIKRIQQKAVSIFQNIVGVQPVSSCFRKSLSQYDISIEESSSSKIDCVCCNDVRTV
jgi:hypothetical protein